MMISRVQDRLHQVVLILSTVAVSWLGMMVVHECGHVLAAWATGGTVNNVVLRPLEFSRTDVFPNPRPLVVAWGGPVFGALAPLAAFAGAAAARLRPAYLLRFFAGYCLVANGAYIGFGAFERAGDAKTMLLFGSPRWQLWMFGIVGWSAGLMLWHRLGSHFGIGPRAQPIRRLDAFVTLALLVLVISGELLFASR